MVDNVSGLKRFDLNLNLFDAEFIRGVEHSAIRRTAVRNSKGSGNTINVGDQVASVEHDSRGVLPTVTMPTANIESNELRIGIYLHLQREGGMHEQCYS